MFAEIIPTWKVWKIVFAEINPTWNLVWKIVIAEIIPTWKVWKIVFAEEWVVCRGQGEDNRICRELRE